MFNLGYKEIVLNDVSYTKLDQDAFGIDGFATLAASGVTRFYAERAQKKAPQETAYSIPGDSGSIGVGTVLGASGDVYNVVIYVEEYSRNRSDFARDFIIDGERLSFQSAPMKAATNDALADAIIEGFNLAAAHFTNAAQIIKLKAGAAANTFNVVMTKEGEDLIIDSFKGVTIQKANPMDQPATKLTEQSIVGFNPGKGQGSWVEESRRMATLNNIRPYGENQQGNSLGVDVHGEYTTFFIEAKEDSSPTGWESHEYLKHGYVQAKMDSKPRRYVLYINEKVSKDLDTDLQAFIGSLVTSDIKLTLADGSAGAADGTDFFA